MSGLQTIQEIVNDLPLSDFSGINDPVDPTLICVHTLAEALKERIVFYMENDPKMMLDFARAFIESVKWQDLAGEKIEEWTNEQA